MIDEQLRILKFMTEMTGHVDMNDFAAKTGLSSGQIVQNMQALAKDGYLKKVSGGFTITEKGKIVIKASTQLPANLRFNFYYAIGQPTGASAGSVAEFHDLAGKVNAASLEFHIGRGDFENWFRFAIGDTATAAAFAKMKEANLKCDDLRKEIVKTLAAKYAPKS